MLQAISAKRSDGHVFYRFETISFPYRGRKKTPNQLRKRQPKLLKRRREEAEEKPKRRSGQREKHATS